MIYDIKIRKKTMRNILNLQYFIFIITFSFLINCQTTNATTSTTNNTKIQNKKTEIEQKITYYQRKMGLFFLFINNNVQKKYRLLHDKGIRVIGVQKNSTAAKAKIKRRDVICKIDNHIIDTKEAFVKFMDANYASGKTMKLQTFQSIRDPDKPICAKTTAEEEKILLLKLQ